MRGHAECNTRPAEGVVTGRAKSRLMTEHEASRTLVKSPPELWAECSEAGSLARHLGQFGEIRITKLEPETAVAWEGEEVSGTVRFEPSGWGTRVILTARATEQQTQKAPIQEPNQTGAELKDPPVDDPPSVDDPPRAGDPQPVDESAPPPDPEPEPEPEPLPPAASAPAPLVSAPQPIRRRGLFARLMAMFQPPEPASSPVPGGSSSTPPPTSAGARTSTPPPLSSNLPPEARPAAAPRPAAVSTATATPPDPPDPPDPPEPFDPPESSDPDVLDALDHDAVLAAALDSLGQAHHRPYSRA